MLRWRSKCSRQAIGGLTGTLILSLGTLPAAAQPRTLYEKLALGRTVIVGTCLAQGRRAVIQVDEVLKGDLGVPRVLISYRLMNWERTTKDSKIEFEVGARSVMLIEPDMTEAGKVKEKNLFVLSGGPEGKIDLPSEGADAFLEAARKMVRVQSAGDQKEVWEEQRRLLEEKNYLLAEAGFQEVLKFRLGNQQMIPLLVDYLGNPRDSFRLGALRILAQIFEGHRRRGEKIVEMDALIRYVCAAARGDSAAEVRAQAVRTLKAVERDDMAEFLKTVARSDPAQIVRYEAQLALLEMGQSAAR